jgi:hypothetical protein
VHVVVLIGSELLIQHLSISVNDAKKMRQVKGTGSRSRQLAFAFDRLPSESRIVISLSLSLHFRRPRVRDEAANQYKTLSALQESRVLWLFCFALPSFLFAFLDDTRQDPSRSP